MYFFFSRSIRFYCQTLFLLGWTAFSCLLKFILLVLKHCFTEKGNSFIRKLIFIIIMFTHYFYILFGLLCLFCFSDFVVKYTKRILSGRVHDIVRVNFRVTGRQMCRWADKGAHVCLSSASLLSPCPKLIRHGYLIFDTHYY